MSGHTNSVSMRLGIAFTAWELADAFGKIEARRFVVPMVRRDVILQRYLANTSARRNARRRRAARVISIGVAS